MTTLTLSNRL